MSGKVGDNVYRASGVIAAAAGGGGAVSWQTDSIKTTGFTATAGEGYFCNTTAGAFTLTLPSSPSAGDIVAVEDYANTFDTNALTIGRGGSDIGGVASDAVVSEEGIAVTVIYIDATQGWKVTNSGLQSEMPSPGYVAGCGGTETTAPCGNYKVHSFTGPGTFTVTCGGNAAGSNSVEWMAVAGGGGGGGGEANTYSSGGGGAGGMRYDYPAPASGGEPVSASPGSYTVVVGGGGTVGAENNVGTDGSDSSAVGYTSAGGGKGGSGPGANPATGADGGSGGGGGGSSTGGSGNTPSTTPSQGNNGGTGCGAATSGRNAGGAGGGHGGVGQNAASTSVGGLGGLGTPLAIGSSPALCGGRTYAGGAVGSQGPACACAGGAPGGGGYGISGASTKDGVVNTGGGGSGGWPISYGDGGSGIVIIRYKFQ